MHADADHTHALLRDVLDMLEEAESTLPLLPAGLDDPLMARLREAVDGSEPLVRTVWRRRPETPVQIEVVVLNAHNVREVAEWCGGEYRIEADPKHPDRTRVTVFLPNSEQVARTESCVCRDGEGRFFTMRREEIVLYFDQVTNVDKEG